MALVAAAALAAPSASYADEVPPDLTPPALAIAASPPAFSPNGDGRRDATAIRVTVDEPATVRVLVRRSGETLRTLASAASVPAGTTDFPWNGRVRSGGRWVTAADGTYGIAVRAADAAGNVSEDSLQVVVDTAAPRIRWYKTSPDPSAGNREVRFYFRVWDRLPQISVTFELLDSEGRRIVRLPKRILPRGDRSLAFDPVEALGRALGRGGHRVRARLGDAAQNGATYGRAGWMRVHRPGRAHVYNRLSGAGRRVALTFDDCYDGGAWREILDVLRRRHAKGSFFCNGANMRRFPSLVRRTVREGHIIGSHTSNHALLTRESESTARRLIRDDQRESFDSARTTTVPWFRPPYGAYDSTVLRAAGREGYTRVLMWDVDPLDWQRPGASAIRSRVVGRARTGSIILMHAIPQTADALNSIISGLRNRNLQPVSVAELFRRAGISPRR